MRIAEQRPLGRDEVAEMYESVGWVSYAKDPDRLLRGLAGSHVVLTARDADGRLRGLARTISDGETTNVARLCCAVRRTWTRSR